MKLPLSKASHYLEMFSGYGRSRNLEEVRLQKLEELPLHKQDQLHMEVRFLETYLVALADFRFSIAFYHSLFL